MLSCSVQQLEFSTAAKMCQQQKLYESSNKIEKFALPPIFLLNFFGIYLLTCLPCCCFRTQPFVFSILFQLTLPPSVLTFSCLELPLNACGCGGIYVPTYTCMYMCMFLYTCFHSQYCCCCCCLSVNFLHISCDKIS